MSPSKINIVDAYEKGWNSTAKNFMLGNQLFAVKYGDKFSYAWMCGASDKRKNKNKWSSFDEAVDYIKKEAEEKAARAARRPEDPPAIPGLLDKTARPLEFSASPSGPDAISGATKLLPVRTTVKAEEQAWNVWILTANVKNEGEFQCVVKSEDFWMSQITIRNRLRRLETSIENLALEASLTEDEGLARELRRAASRATRLHEETSAKWPRKSAET
ncbi:hypothetical protein AB4Y72_14830 [Arthrobacter sp. YAF34]|uniref:hypothetical protein n=1 Tax=Arthrobacter sp. YAF34 TaxID=3233083 RepID=UPI003F920A9E